VEMRKEGKGKVKKELQPRFETEEQEAEYWDSHSPLDLGAELKAQKLRVKGAKDRPITVRLDSESRSKLDKLAAEQGLGPSSFARRILMSVIGQGCKLPKRSITLNEFEDMLDALPQSIKEQASSLVAGATIGGDPDNPTILLLDKPQIDKLEKLGLQAIFALLAMYGVQVVTRENDKHKKAQAVAESHK